MVETNLKSPPEKGSEADRRKMIAERQRTSTVWWLIHCLASLKLALFLLFTIALACAAATFAESSFTTKVAQVYIYKNPLFTLWLVVLCVNLFCVTLSRLPWQRKHAGFIITHYGIITLLAGAMIGHAIGYEAFVRLEKGEAPKTSLLTNDPFLFIKNSSTNRVYSFAFEPEVKKPSPARPRQYRLEGSDLEIVVDQFSENLSASSELAADPVRGTAPGISLKLASNSLHQNLQVPLLLGDKNRSGFDMFGLAKIEWLEKLPPLPDPRQEAPMYRESQMIFALQPDNPILHNSNGTPAGYHFTLLPKQNGSAFDLEIIFPDSRRQMIDLKEALKKPIPGAQPSTQISVVQYWPDLQMVNGKPVSASGSPNNPAALITFSGVIEDPLDKIPHLLLAPLDNGKIAYQLRKGQVVTSQGNLSKDGKLSTGWNDWTVELLQFFPKARLTPLIHGPEENSTAKKGAISGLHIYLKNKAGQNSEAKWIALGSSDILEIGTEQLRIGYDTRIIPIPFGVSLVDFQVPRDEGTSTPANFISSILFHPPDGSAPIPARSEMNFPASYPPEFWRQLTGSTYKFSQAGWNPDNPNETTLQVLHDPGWILKWIGSLMICGGIFTMFYLKPQKSAPAPKATQPS